MRTDVPHYCRVAPGVKDDAQDLIAQQFNHINNMKRRKITNAAWAEIRTAYASGIGLREIARNINIPAGTILARVKREG